MERRHFLSISALSVITTGVAAPSVKKWFSGNKSITCWGDSLTSGSGGTPYPTRLAELSRLKVGNQGVGGQGSGSIAARQGGRIPLFTPENGIIKGSGGTLVKHRNLSPLTVQSQDAVIWGEWAGVQGSVTRSTDGNYLFSRTTPGAPVSINEGAPFIVNAMGRDYDITIIWAGRNNLDKPRQVLNDVASMVRFLKPVMKKYIIMSPPNSEFEVAGSDPHRNLSTIRDGLREAFPDNFIDIWQKLIDSYSPDSEQDVANYKAGVTPTSLRADNIHLNTAGYELVAHTVYQFMVAKKW